MPPTTRRAILAFLVAPLAGVATCWLLLVATNQPRGTAQAPFVFLFVYMPFYALPIYGAAWAVGLPAYLVLRRLGAVRTMYFALVLALAGVSFILKLSAHHWDPATSPTWLLVGGLTGLVTGTVLGHMLSGGPIVPDGTA